MLRIIFFTIFPLLVQPAYASSEKGSFTHWVDEFVQEARDKSISDSTLELFHSNAKEIPQVVSYDRNQPHATTKFIDYLQKITPQSRVNRAKQKIEEHREILNEVEQKFGVQKRFIVALWAIESNFGTNMGSFNIPNSLATLSYDGRRASFFRKELFHALTIIDQQHISYDNMKGSWAGAMGQTQFMPSSFLDYAIDYNQNGKKDIWTEKEDVFASIANYLATKGWDSRYTWGREVMVPEDLDQSLFDRDITKPLPLWQELGIRKRSGAALPNVDIDASLIQVNNTHSYLIYDNYKTLLKWNRSLYFASAVGILADKIGD